MLQHLLRLLLHPALLLLLRARVRLLLAHQLRAFRPHPRRLCVRMALYRLLLPQLLCKLSFSLRLRSLLQMLSHQLLLLLLLTEWSQRHSCPLVTASTYLANTSLGSVASLRLKSHLLTLCSVGGC